MFRLLFLILISFKANAVELDISTLQPDAPGRPEYRINSTTVTPTPSKSDVKFRFLCGAAKTGRFDPIVSYGSLDFGHYHQFIGNTGINPFSTTDSLKNSGNSTCDGGTAMRSSYWFPVLYDTQTGKAIWTSGAIIYYTTGTSVKATQEATQAFPDGLVMIAGESKNTAEGLEGWAKRKIYFKCYTPGVSGSATALMQSIPVCRKGDVMQVQISFRNCWDGKNLDSPDHKSHMAYSGSGTLPTYCPSTHPVRLTEIGLTVSYPVTTDTTEHWRYTSDMYDEELPGGYSIHADFMNGSNDYVKTMMLENCFKAGMDCGMGLLGRDPVDGLYKRIY